MSEIPSVNKEYVEFVEERINSLENVSEGTFLFNSGRFYAAHKIKKIASSSRKDPYEIIRELRNTFVDYLDGINSGTLNFKQIHFDKSCLEDYERRQRRSEYEITLMCEGVIKECEFLVDSWGQGLTSEKEGSYICINVNGVEHMQLIPDDLIELFEGVKHPAKSFLNAFESLRSKV